MPDYASALQTVILTALGTASTGYSGPTITSDESQMFDHPGQIHEAKFPYVSVCLPRLESETPLTDQIRECVYAGKLFVFVRHAGAQANDALQAQIEGEVKRRVMAAYSYTIGLGRNAVMFSTVEPVQQGAATALSITYRATLTAAI